MIQKGVEIPNTFRMKVKADCFVEYDSEEVLAEIDFDALPKPVTVSPTNPVKWRFWRGIP